MFLIILGIIVLIYWISFFIFLFYDQHFSHANLDFAMKFLLPVAILANIIGIILGIIQIGKEKNKRTLKFAVICLNAIPLICVVCFFFWLYFGFRI
jgi:type III secretory pathway component EscS